MKKPELLSPAGNFEKLKVAIENGADAVYLGIEEFNARANEDNFTLDNLKMGIDYAHLFGVKVYLTLNILFEDSEISSAMNVAERALLMGVDALIVQDIAIACLIRKTFPNAVLHASTQMGCCNLEGARYLKNLGFSRIVLARETQIEDIKLIKQNVDIEIEYFVQGALCVSYSGNCYLCSLLANASGNRGKCKQYCRLSCLLNGKGVNKKGYLISTKDICLLPKLQELTEAGVDSFKIEGRARREAYTGRVTKVYRNAIDNGFAYSEKNINSLKKVFNRGDYCQGYLENEKMIFDKVQNHIGIEIGKVEKINKGKRFTEIFVSSSQELAKGDLLKFFDKNGEKGVISCEDVKKVDKNVYRVTSTFTPNKGDSVRLILDAIEDEEVLNAQRFVQFNAIFEGKINEKAKLILRHGEDEIYEESEQVLEKAKSHPLTENEVRENINKINYPFKLNKFECDIDNVFLVKSSLNLMRRNGEEKLKNKIICNYLLKNHEKFEKNDIKCNIFSQKQQKHKYLMTNIKDFSLNFDGFIFNAESYDDKTFEGIDFENKKIFLNVPVFASQDEVDKIKNILIKYPHLGVYANNYYALDLTSKDKTIIGDGLNVYNSFAVAFYVSKGYKNIVLTKENIDKNQIHNCGANLICFKSYYPEYMNFAHCPIKEHIGGNCGDCKFSEGLTYKIAGKDMVLARRKINKCHFILKSKEMVNEKESNYSEIYEEFSGGKTK